MSQGIWTVSLQRDVTRYLVPGDMALREKRAAVREAVASLQKGIPKDAYFIETDPNTSLEVFRWIEVRHWITFAADRDKKWIYVMIMEPMTPI